MLGACITFGLLAPVSKSLFGTGLVSAYALTMMRMGGGAVVFWIASLFTRREHVPPRDLLLFFFASLLGIVLNQGTYVLGVSKTSPIDASVVTTTTPIFVMIIAALYLREPITGKKILGVVVGAGVSVGRGAAVFWAAAVATGISVVAAEPPVVAGDATALTSWSGMAAVGASVASGGFAVSQAANPMSRTMKSRRTIGFIDGFLVYGSGLAGRFQGGCQQQPANSAIIRPGDLPRAAAERPARAAQQLLQAAGVGRLVRIRAAPAAQLGQVKA